MNADLPIRVSRNEHTISRRQIDRHALTVLYELKRNGYLAFLAGGGVRDLLIGRQPKDFDIATDATPEQIRKLFRRCRLVGRRFRLAHVLFAGGFVEVATFRKTAANGGLESDKTDPGEEARSNPRFMAREGMILRDNEYGTPAEDAVRRDFTINALFYDIRDFTVVDYVDGLTDLRQGIIRSIGDPDIRFVEDPVRMLRAIRFAATLGFAIDPDSSNAISRHYSRLAMANRHRLYDEWLKVAASGALASMGASLLETGLLEVLWPDFAVWLRSADDGRRKRYGMACRHLDRWRRQTGAPVPSELCLAILMGEYFEQQTTVLAAAGRPWFTAALETVDKGMSTDKLPMAVPRGVVQNTARLMAVQERFKPGYGGRRRRFQMQAIFKPALEVFRFLCRAQQRPAEWLTAWQDAGGDEAAGTIGQNLQTARHRRRKPRRGGRRGAARTPAPRPRSGLAVKRASPAAR